MLRRLGCSMPFERAGVDVLAVGSSLPIFAAAMTK